MEWHTANQITVAWDAVEKCAESTCWVKPEDSLKYAVYTKVLPSGEPVLLGEQDNLSAVITFEAEGRYIVGVSAVRYVAGDNERIETNINWSDENGEYTPNPFGGKYYIVGDPPKNLHRQ